MAQCTGVLRLGVIVSTVVSVLFIICGVFLFFWFPNFIQGTISKKVAVNNGSDSYKIWRKSPFPVDFGVYLFHVENPDAVVNGEKPILSQKGPYIFKQYKEKFDISFDDENDYVSFRGKKTYFYDEENSNGSLSDNITILNVPLVGVSKNAMKLTGFQKMMLNMLIQMYKSKPFVTRNVSQLLFEGYHDALIEALAKAQKKTLLPNNTFGFLYGQNGSTADSLYTINRGNVNISEVVNIEAIDNKTYLPYWGTKYCNMINGTDGSQFPPPITRTRDILLYTAELCRSVNLRYKQDVIVEGIKLLRYTTPDSLLAEATVNPDNACFCLEGNCLKSGVMNISVCKKGAPIVVSMPHFYQADVEYVNAVEGLHPVADMHQIYIDVEPFTGVVMSAGKRLQMNADVKPVPGLAGYAKMPSLIFPLLWVYESAAIKPASAEKFKSQLQTPIMIANAVTYGLLAIGVFVLLCLGACFIVSLLRRREGRMTVVTNRSGARVANTENTGPASEKLLTKPVFA